MNLEPGLVTFICISGVVLNVITFTLMVTFATTLERCRGVISSLPKKVRVAIFFIVLIPWAYEVFLFVGLLCILVATIVYITYEFLEM